MSVEHNATPTSSTTDRNRSLPPKRNPLLSRNLPRNINLSLSHNLSRNRKRRAPCRENSTCITAIYGSEAYVRSESW